MAPRRQILTREDWIEAARKVLVAAGVDDVKVDRLSRQLKVTRGSFYWHFKNRKDLLDALLDGWKQQNLSEIAQVRNRRREAGPDMVEVVRIWLQEDPAYPTFDMAIRFWARKDPAVAALVRRTDDEWIGLLQAIFQANGEGELASLARARITYFHQIGYYALAIEESLEDRLALSPYYHAVLTGTAGGSALEGLISELRSAPSAKS
ncbi:TetR/AcrR family transcriptional regulator [Phenylobacterium sp.]|uniref:TetR/AcrR family transcriptional regulator n=1 Tax=Phenylobacterium sp. TaxID=1871053 RepID=UPI0037CBA2F2